jgi:hypothetical protein
MQDSKKMRPVDEVREGVETQQERATRDDVQSLLQSVGTSVSRGLGVTRGVVEATARSGARTARSASQSVAKDTRSLWQRKLMQADNEWSLFMDRNKKLKAKLDATSAWLKARKEGARKVGVRAGAEATYRFGLFTDACEVGLIWAHEQMFRQGQKYEGAILRPDADDEEFEVGYEGAEGINTVVEVVTTRDRTATVDTAYTTGTIGEDVELVEDAHVDLSKRRTVSVRSSLFRAHREAVAGKEAAFQERSARPLVLSRDYRVTLPTTSSLKEVKFVGGGDTVYEFDTDAVIEPVVTRERRASSIERDIL